MKIFTRVLTLFLFVVGAAYTLYAFDGVMLKRMLDVTAQRTEKQEEKSKQLKQMLDVQEAGKKIDKRLKLLRIVLLHAQDPHKHEKMFKDAKNLFPELKDKPEQLKRMLGLLDAVLKMYQEKSGIKRLSAAHLEAYLAATNLTDFFNYMVDPKKLSGDNPIRKLLAGHWIRNAALRVFSNDLRSFLEIVVNACDASLPAEKSVGKFGMGFFSILSFLSHKETKGTTITIDTRARVSQDRIDGFGITIENSDFNSWDDNNISFTLKAYPVPLQAAQPGTTIFIRPNKGVFLPESLSELRRYVYNLQFEQEVKITLVYQDKIETIGKGDSQKEVIVFITPSLLLVHDAGSGMSVETALKNLLIPSSSTKKPAVRADVLREVAYDEFEKKPEDWCAKLGEWEGKKNKGSSYFVLTVNGVVVVNKELKLPIEGHDKKAQDIILNMPQVTELTLARDELAILPDGKSFEEQWIKKIIQATIDKALDLSGKQNLGILMHLYQGLEAWEEQTALTAIKGKFTQFFKQQLEQTLNTSKKIVVAPVNYTQQLQAIVDTVTEKNKYILLPLADDLVYHNFSKLEKILIEAAQKKIGNQDSFEQKCLHEAITKGTKLIFLPDGLLGKTDKIRAKPENFALRTILFVPQSFLSDVDNKVSIEENTKKLYDKLSASPIALVTPKLAKKMEDKYPPFIVSTIKRTPGLKETSDYTPSDFYVNVFKPAVDRHDWPSAIDLSRSSELDSVLKDFFKKQATDEINKIKSDEMSSFLLFSLFYQFGVTSITTPGKLYVRKNGELSEVWPALKESIKDLIKNRTSLVELNGLSELDLGAVNDALVPFDEKVQKATTYIQNLQGSGVDTGSIGKYFIDLAVIEKTCADNGAIKNMTESMFSMMYALYDNFLDIKSSDITYVYGGGNTGIATINPIDDVSSADVVRLLNGFAQKDSDINSNLIDVQKADFVLKTDLVEKKEALKGNKLYMPSFLSNTPISMLAFLMNKGVALSVIGTVIKKSRSSDELLFIAHILAHEQIGELIKGLQAKDGAHAAGEKIAYVITRFIQKRVTPGKTQEVAQEYRKLKSLAERLRKIEQEESFSLVQEYLKSALTTSDSFCDMTGIYNKYNALVGEENSFSLKKFIKTHAQPGSGLEKQLQGNNLRAVLDAIAHTQGEYTGNKITQCVEAGSERSPFEASMIETVQNSIDAVKGFDKNKGKEEFKATCQARGVLDSAKIRTIALAIGKIQGQDKNKSSACYSIQDLIGMPSLENLIALPDYSKKSPALGNIGDMGNGLFQLYKDAQAVFFITRVISDPNKIFILRGVPVRLQGGKGLVDDLSLTCIEVTPDDIKDIETKDWFGTRIIIKFREQEDNATTMQLLESKDFIHNCAGATNVKIGANPLIITLREKQESGTEKDKKINNFVEGFLPDLVFKDMACNTYKRDRALLESYITTGGVPFRPLGEFLREESLLPSIMIPLINSGFIIDLPLGTYEPVQSRTHIKMAEADKKKLEAFLLEFVYWCELDKAQKNPALLDSYFTHFSSRCSDFSQVELSEQAQAILTSDKRTFFSYYRPVSKPGKSFYELIEDGYQNVVEKLKEERNKIHTALSNKAKLISEAINSKGNREDQQRTITQEVAAWVEFRKTQEDVLKKNGVDILGDWKKSLQESIAPQQKNLLIDNVVVPWFNNKIPTLELKMPYIKCAILRKNAASNAAPVEIDLADFKLGSGKDISHGLDYEIENLANKKGEFDTVLGYNRYKEVVEQLQDKENGLAALLNKYLQTYVDSFCQVLPTEKYFKHPWPPIKFALFDPKKSGTSEGRELYINLASRSIASILTHIMQLITDDVISATEDQPVYTDLFSPKFLAGTVVHELEHARRFSDPNGKKERGPHDPLDIEGDGQMRDFNDCANYIAEKAKTLGSLDTWKTMLSNSLDNDFDLSIDEDLKKLQSLIAQLEKIDKKRLIKEVLKIDTSDIL